MHVLNHVQTFYVALFTHWFEVIWFLVVVELASVSIGAIPIVVEVFALLGPIVGGDVWFRKQFVLAMSKSAFGTKLAFAHFPISANFCFEFLLKVVLGSHISSRLDSFNIRIKGKSSVVLIMSIEIIFFVLVVIWCLFLIVEILSTWRHRRRC